MVLKRDRSSSPANVPENLEGIFWSEPVEDQKSTFIAAYSATLSAKALQALPEFKTASHRIAAWRKPSRQKSLLGDARKLYDMGHDDDGEKWAGNRLQHVLQNMNIEGTVVVARWYGGVLLGPMRFTHIENVAKEAIWKSKSAETEAQQEAARKKQKLAQDEARKELEKSLVERDESILTLRGLLAEKQATLNGTEPAPPTPGKKPPDYSKMTEEMLNRMDKARDATLKVILDEINKVEEKLKSLIDSPDSSPDLFSTPTEGQTKESYTKDVDKKTKEESKDSAT